MKMNTEEKKLFAEFQVGTQNEIISNRFSGEKVSLCPEAVAVYDFLIGAEFLLSQNFNEEIYHKFYTAKNIFVKNWPKEYMILLD